MAYEQVILVESRFIQSPHKGEFTSREAET